LPSYANASAPEGQPLPGARHSARRAGLPAADDDLNVYFHIAMAYVILLLQRGRRRYDGLAWSDQLDRRGLCAHNESKL